MKFSNPNSLWVALGVGVLTSVSMLPQARGEMVYESESQFQAGSIQAPQQLAAPVVVQAPVQAPAPVQVMQAPQQVYPAQVPQQPVQLIQPQLVQPQPVFVQQQPHYAAPRATYAPAVAEGQPEEPGMISKAEMVRRERMRAELRNEDVLQERLEELRLRDERRRSEELVAGQQVGSSATVASSFGQLPQTPATERVGQLAQTAPIPVAMQASPIVMATPTSDPYSAGMVTTASAADLGDRDVTVVYMQPRFGITTFNNVTFYDIRPKYSAGFGLGLSVSDNLSFEIGYLYSEYGVAMNSTNPYAIGAQVQANARGYTGVFETVAMKQNIGDAGLKIHFLGPSAKLRPYIGGGGAYSRSFINFNQNVIALMQQSGLPSPDYDMTQFLGFLSSGFDVRVNKAISIGAGFKYYTVLSSRQNQNLSNQALAYPYGGYIPNYYALTTVNDADKQIVGGSLAQNSFYSVTGAVSFSF